MTTTLSDEEFQRLNDQLLELKVQNYNLESTLSKTSIECNTLKSENEQLRRQLPTTNTATHSTGQNATEHGGGGGGTTGQSIKQKLNPFMFAKSIANKVEQAARINSTHSHQQQQQQQQHHHHQAEVVAAHRLESQELDFIKTNDMLKNEINLLQLQLEQSEANNKHLRDQVERLEETSALQQNGSSVASEVDSIASTNNNNDEQTYSPSRQLQQSLEMFANSMRNRAQKNTVNHETLVQSFIASLDNRDPNKYKVIEAIANVITERGLDGGSSSNSHEEDLSNTTEDFKQIWHFFDRSQQTNLEEVKSLIGLLCHSFVDYDSKSRLAREAELTSERERHDREMEQLKREMSNQATAQKESDQQDMVRLTEEKIERLKNKSKRMIEDLKEVSLRDIERVKEEHFEAVDRLREHYDEAARQQAEQTEQIRASLMDAQTEIESLQTAINESVNEHKISEKRGFKIIKELKKQLNSEKNRADKLQAILNSEPDLVDGGKSSSVSHLLGHHQHQSESALTSDKCSSSGSWSYMNDGPPGAQSPNNTNNKVRHGSVHSDFSDLEIVSAAHPQRNAFPVGSSSMAEAEANVASTSVARPIKKSISSSRVASSSSIVSSSMSTLEQENAQLLARVSNLQQEKWRLEEQVNQLEFETQRLATELGEKNKLIQHYCIEGRPPVLGPVVDSPSGPVSPTSPLQNGRSVNHSSSSNNHRHSISSTSSSVSSSTFSASAAKSPTSINNSVLRVVNYLKERSEAVTNADSAKQMAEVNRKLQRMVEEILTKNMHLQGNLEQMSDQLMDLRTRLRKYEPLEPN